MKARYSIRVKLFDWNPWSSPKFPYYSHEKEELDEHVPVSYTHLTLPTKRIV